MQSELKKSLLFLMVMTWPKLDLLEKSISFNVLIYGLLMDLPIM